MAFDPLGNITSKSDVGTYSYPASGSAHPHAVSSITGIPAFAGTNGVVNPTFTYDADGNMTAGDGRTVTPTSFNMAASIVQGSTSLCLAYDSDHARITQVQTSATCASPGSSATTTTYLNGAGAMEELFVSGLTSTWRDYIVADSGIVALRSNASGTVTMAYFNGDHLGSTSVLTNASGAVTERDSYDAWGRRRNANGTDSTACSIASATTRGYTAQEMLDAVCAINLNARVYDPTIGRVMSADSTVPNAFNGQSFNRYSYVENGPLSAIDPSGFAPTGSTCNPDSSGIPHCTYDATTGNSGIGIVGPETVIVEAPKWPGPVEPSDVASDGLGFQIVAGTDGSVVTQVVETVEITAKRLKQLDPFRFSPPPFDITSLFISPAEAGEFNPVSKKDPNGKPKDNGQCLLVAGAGNLMRISGHIVNVGSTAVLAVGVGIGVLAAPETNGGSFSIMAGFGAVAFGGYTIGGYLDAAGALTQSAGTGDSSYQDEVAIQSSEEHANDNAAGPLAPVVDAAQTATDGLEDTFSGGPRMASCR